MAENASEKKRPVTADWFVQGALTRIGDAFDRLLGRGWRPSSSLATSELAERLKKMLDSEAKETADNRKFVPHNIELKVQWDKFSTDSESSLRKLENELLTAVVDHINDRRYYTYSPLSLTVKPDYFISGVKLFASFDKAEEREIDLDITVPEVKIDIPAADQPEPPPADDLRVTARFEIAGQLEERVLEMTPGDRFSIGRTKENDIALDDPSVSKMHASLVLNRSGELLLADTGSTNGTFVDGTRIEYGKAERVGPERRLRFGTVDVALEIIERSSPPVDRDAAAGPEPVRIGEFEFSSGDSVDSGIPPTAPSLKIAETQLLRPVGDPSPADGRDESSSTS